MLRGEYDGGGEMLEEDDDIFVQVGYLYVLLYFLPPPLLFSSYEDSTLPNLVYHRLILNPITWVARFSISQE